MELNPNHPTTQVVSDHWHKIAAVLMLKMGEQHVVITSADVAAIGDRMVGIVVQELDDGLHLRLVDEATANRLADEHGGRPN